MDMYSRNQYLKELRKEYLKIKSKKEKDKVDCFVKTRKFDLMDIIDEALNLQLRYFLNKGIKHQLLISRGLQDIL